MEIIDAGQDFHGIDFLVRPCEANECDPPFPDELGALVAGLLVLGADAAADEVTDPSVPECLPEMYTSRYTTKFRLRFATAFAEMSEQLRIGYSGPRCVAHLLILGFIVERAVEVAEYWDVPIPEDLGETLKYLLIGELEYEQLYEGVVPPRSIGPEGPEINYTFDHWFTPFA
ncbi:hypothetical protein DEU34_1335 [Microbacterium sp. AG1240]|uniref:hypothetical protein n=1 Tax=Microbacterium sp. AG1240 TaxID=2183992 RepID=UPI000EB2F337|nr:hypothetical protein [Microbacterium sp. AG1240]RKT36809.1 hypothetical protein DEU34_1335 [Microbacterium sp. AG1240]